MGSKIKNEHNRVPRRSIKLRNIDSTINLWQPLDSQYYCTIILIAQIIVSCRGNIGSCAIYYAIVTLDVKSYCTNSQSLSLELYDQFSYTNLPSFIYLLFFPMYIYIYKCVIDLLYTIFISFFHLNAFVNLFFHRSLCPNSIF